MLLELQKLLITNCVYDKIKNENAISFIFNNDSVFLKTSFATFIVADKINPKEILSTNFIKNL